MKYTLYRIFIYILSTDLRNFVLEKESLQIEKKIEKKYTNREYLNSMNRFELSSMHPSEHAIVINS